MKRRFLLSALSALLVVFSASFVLNEKSPVASDICPACAFKGFKLYGKVKVVESFPDIKVQIVESFPDLKVKQVTSFPDQCGEWQFVESFPDIKVQFVTSFPDIKIKYVESFPGCN
jgi:hypothetical protein